MAITEKSIRALVEKIQTIPAENVVHGYRADRRHNRIIRAGFPSHLALLAYPGGDGVYESSAQYLSSVSRRDYARTHTTPCHHCDGFRYSWVGLGDDLCPICFGSGSVKR